MQRPVVGEMPRISASALLHNLQIEHKVKYDDGDWMRIRNDTEAEIMKGILNNKYHKYESLEVPQHDTVLQFDYVKSNLGKGYIFYFVCKCGKRALHLYQVAKDSPLGCRTCCQLRYKKVVSRKTNIDLSQVQHVQVITQQNKQVNNKSTDLNPTEAIDWDEKFKKFLEQEKYNSSKQ